jgi:hypothetical protein
VNEIMGKAKDAAAMFWQALTEDEKRLVVFYGCYVTFSGWSMLRARARRAERAELRDEILQEIRG